MPSRIAQCRLLVALDPGLNGTGVAVFQDATPIRTEVVYTKRGAEWWRRARAIADAVAQITEEESRKTTWSRATPYRVVCETTQYMGTGMGWKTGDLQRLTFLDGVLYERLRPAPFLPILPMDWKGQLPKPVVEDRIRKILGATVCRKLKIETHAWDATGIGLWAVGRF